MRVLTDPGRGRSYGPTVMRVVVALALLCNVAGCRSGNLFDLLFVGAVIATAASSGPPPPSLRPPPPPPAVTEEDVLDEQREQSGAPLPGVAYAAQTDVDERDGLTLLVRARRFKKCPFRVRERVETYRLQAGVRRSLGVRSRVRDDVGVCEEAPASGAAVTVGGATGRLGEGRLDETGGGSVRVDARALLGGGPDLVVAIDGQVVTGAEVPLTAWWRQNKGVLPAQAPAF